MNVLTFGKLDWIWIPIILNIFVLETAMGIRLNTQSGMSREYIHSVHK